MRSRRLTASFVALLATTSLFFWLARRGKPSAPAQVDGESPYQEALAISPSYDASPSQPPATATNSAVDGAPRTEGELMQHLREIANTQPAVAVTLARDGNRRFADSHDAPERTWILIHALADLGRSAEARGEAETMVNHYPDSHWVREIEQFTGAHRHRNLRLDDAGNLEYVDPN